MGLFRQRSRLRPLDEHECYARLHGRRSGDVEVLREPRARTVPTRAAPLGPDHGSSALPAPAAARGPTDVFPAPHLVIAYPRGRGRITGEQLRRQLLARMERRTGQAA